MNIHRIKDFTYLPIIFFLDIFSFLVFDLHFYQTIYVFVVLYGIRTILFSVHYDGVATLFILCVTTDKNKFSSKYVSGTIKFCFPIVIVSVLCSNVKVYVFVRFMIIIGKP